MLTRHLLFLKIMKNHLPYSCWLRMGDAVNYCLKTNKKKMNKMIINNEYIIFNNC